MAQYTVTSPTLSLTDRDGNQFFSDFVVGTDANAGNIAWTCPSNVGPSGGWLRHLNVYSIGAATLHDLHADGEVASVIVTDVSGRQRFPALLARAHYVFYGSGVAVPSGWCADWHPPIDLIVYPGDILEFHVPPADDNGTPTGDYQVKVGIHPL